jgi:hypothetical protein
VFPGECQHSGHVIHLTIILENLQAKRVDGCKTAGFDKNFSNLATMFIQRVDQFIRG